MKDLMQHQQVEQVVIVADNATRPLISVTETTHLEIPPLVTFKSKPHTQGAIQRLRGQVARMPLKQLSRWDACSSPVKAKKCGGGGDDNDNDNNEYRNLKSHRKDTSDALSSLLLKKPVRRYSFDNDSDETLQLQDDKSWSTSKSPEWKTPCKTSMTMTNELRKPRRNNSFEIAAGGRVDTERLLDEALLIVDIPL